jgi:hypothetical protein
MSNCNSNEDEKYEFEFYMDWFEFLLLFRGTERMYLSTKFDAILTSNILDNGQSCTISGYTKNFSPFFSFFTKTI